MKRVVFLLFCLTFLFTACPMDRFSCFHVENNSNKIIVVTAGYILPDTLLPENPKFLKTIPIGQSRIIYDSDVEDGDLQRMENGERITLFVLSKDSVDNHSWEYVRENNVILKRYEFNMEELKNMSGGGYLVNYP
jgi:hypothetical protein